MKQFITAIENIPFEIVRFIWIQTYRIFYFSWRLCGHDMLRPQLIKASAAAIAQPIANIFNASIAQGCYPSAW